MSKLRRQLETGMVWSSKNDMSPLDGLRRATESASDESLKRWASETLELLQDENLVLRTRAVAALDMLPADPSAVLHLLHAQPELFEVACEGYPLFPSYLDEAIWFWLADKPEATEDIRERLEEQPYLVPYLAEHDYDWVLKNAKKVVARDVLGGVLISFPKELRPELIRSLRPFNDAEEVLQAAWWRRLEDADKLREIVSIG